MTAFPKESMALLVRQGLVQTGPCYVSRVTPKPVLTAAQQAAKEARMTERMSAVGRKGGAPMSVLTPQKLRIAAKLKEQGKRVFQIARVLGVDDATISHHLRGSRAMRAAVKTK